MELGEYALEPLRKDEEFILYRGQHRGPKVATSSILLLTPVSTRPTPETVKKIEHEYSFRSELDATWAVRPLALSRHIERTVLVLEDPGGEPLNHLIHGPMRMRQFLRIATGIAAANSQLHKRGLIHKDLKPPNVLVNPITGKVWLMGFGIASRLPRERQSPEPPEFIAGTLAYMAPEQTGRTNRSIDARSDLYALGVTLYEMLTGILPFTASDPMEWVHCHIARQPVPPSEVLRNVPVSISAIIMKLLAKTPEERYQTAVGAESDLRRCLVEWNAQGHVDEFVLGQNDTPNRLLIPEKLYGRAQEIDTLSASLDRVVVSGRTELVLVSGYSGIGKSSVVNELHKVLVPPRGLFASGKFDQYKRDIPYATLAQCFQGLIRPLLGKNEAELRKWRDKLLEALDPNGLLIVDLLPELKAIIGEQPPVPELPSRDSQHRFQLVFRRFIGVFARPEHPLALFLDDLQWLDAATLDVLEDLLTQPDVHHLMLIGAYRNNEVNSVHPLMRKLEAIRQAGGKVHEIVLAPLASEDLERLIADSLHCDQENAAPLAQLIHEKTAGNPFFAIQFISALAEEELLKFDNGEARWSWDLNRIYAKGYTDNVADLMVGKLNRLPLETQSALHQLACLGNSAEFSTIQLVYQESSQEMHSQLWEAVKGGLIFRSQDSYKFLHDRVQEAAYSLIPQELRAEAHLRIGRLLAANTPPEKLEERIFQIVNQLNCGSQLITSDAERVRVAELNFIAGRRAKISTAYASALKYLAAGRALLTQESWEHRYELIFCIECDMAECELLTADMVAAENRLTLLAQHAKSGHDIAVVTRLCLTLYTTLDRSDRGVEVCLDYLRLGGTNWSPHPTSEEVRREYDRIWSLVGTRQIEELIDLPLMTNPDLLDSMEVLTEVVTPALFCDENLSSLVICRMVNLSLEHGNCDASCFAYVWLAIIAGPRFSNYKDGFRFGRLGYDLVEKRGLKRFQARTYMSFGDIVMPWTKHVQAGRDLVRRAFDAANEIGDVTFAAYSCDHLIKNLLAAGDELAEVQREAENALAFAQKVRFGLVIDHLTAQLGLVRTLRGLTAKFGSFDDQGFDELRFERRLASNPALAELECWYWVRKLQARFFAGDYASAVASSVSARRQLWTSPSQFETAELSFYGALSHAASWDSALPDQRQQHLEPLKVHHRQLEVWAENCPENFENRAALVSAEIARIEGRVLDAEQLYEKAIRSAHLNGFVQNEALANELAARFYLPRGFEKIAYVYLQNARYGYLRWGATAKVRQLDELYPQLRQEKPALSSTSTIETQVEHLDLATVIKVSQAVSGETVLEKLIDTLMRTAIEHAGAERGLLILPQGDELRIEAEATTGGAGVIVRQREAAVSALPESIVHFVARTQECVILDDAATHNNLFSGDTYIRQRHARSILCLPLMNQAKLVGVLYLENNLAPQVFTPTRITVLKLLAYQAAISLENASLYSHLKRSEAYLTEAQRLSHTGSFGCNLSTGEMFWSEETFRIYGYDRSTQPAVERVLQRVHPEDKRLVQEQIDRASRGGQDCHVECRLLLPDDSVKHVRIVAHASKNEPGNIEFIGAVMDVTAAKQAEENLRRSEAYLAEAQKLSHTGSFGWNVYGGEIYWSPETFRIFEYEPAVKVTIELIMQRTHPEDRSAVRQLIDRVSRERTDFDIEHRLLMPDGSVKYLRVIGSPSKNEDGSFEFVGAVTDITERKRGEEALRRSEAYLAEAQRVTHTGSWASDGITREALHWSEEMFRIFGFDPQQGLPMRDQWLQRIHPEDRDKVKRQASEKMFLQKVDADLDYRIVLPDGTVKHIHGLAHPVFDSNRELVEVIGTAVDITEQRHAEEALGLSEERYRSVLETATDAVVSVDEGSRIIFANPATTKTFGYQISEMIGQPLAMLMPEVMRGVHKAGFEGYLKTNQRHADWRGLEVIGLRQNGEEFPVEVSFGEVLVSGHHLFTGFIRDTTERKQAEAKIRQSEMQLQQILDFAPQHVTVLGPDGSRLYLNQAGLDYYGLTLEEWRAHDARGFFHPDDLQRVNSNASKFLSGSSCEIEARLRRKDGKYRWFLIRRNPLRDEQGRPIRWYATATDIEDRKEAEQRLHDENVALREEIDRASMFDEIVGISPALHAVLSRVSKVAPTDSTVLITGETGTGKELVARAIHRRSHRSSRAFVSVNCAAIPRDLIASELFGHEKGAFTGATQRRLGRFELAEGGTIFLDEIGELPAETQVALLRVLQEHEFERVGGTGAIRTNVRVIAATNRDLGAAIASGTFRNDLFYRLNVFPIEVPPLRERQEDIPVLVEYFIDRYARKAGKSIRGVNKKSLKLLQSYPWPGNIRELQNVIERSVIVCDTENFSVDESWLSQQPLASEPRSPVELSQKLAAQEKEMIEAALRESGGRVSGPSGAAAKLGIPGSTLETKIRSLQINKYRFKTAGSPSSRI